TVDGLAIARTAAVRDPCTGAGAHHRLERGDKAARGTLHAHAAIVAHVDVRLAVGYDDDVVAVQFAAERGAKRLLVPDALAAVEWPIRSEEHTSELQSR